MADGDQRDAQQLTHHFAAVAFAPSNAQHLPVHPQVRPEVELSQHMRPFQGRKRASRVAGGLVAIRVVCVSVVTGLSRAGDRG